MSEIPEFKLDVDFEQLERMLQDLKVMARDVDNFEESKRLKDKIKEFEAKMQQIRTS
jgi:hypothetical protein